MTEKATKRQRIIIDPSGTWDCSLCTYKNPCIIFRCEMCDTHKGTATRKPKLVLNFLSEQLARSKRKINADYFSDVPFTDDDDDDESEYNLRKTNHYNRLRRASHNENNSSTSLKTSNHSNLSRRKKSTTDKHEDLNKNQRVNVHNQKNTQDSRQQKKKATRFSSMSSSIDSRTIVTVDGISVQIIELSSMEANSFATNNTLFNDSVASRTSPLDNSSV
ncbi:unnamed protein product [Rotaria magnacalcarata]|uniref:RanBP2-type domain-containing protein n=1 Tax=Rotaria magnacalcarata TaxID=392030 RepID=A0A816S4D7_9BILA|nr:unnamed protein product [Rotaria magnacalcarata]CAF1462292.1 unnamed protein product [Rotaria magnacalcarata]CAF2081762.1 unnamed protein product [Rotaria magnacalcarata]CAF3841600.1 unnamed protein product [Rotaria magnacalcarata]CAF4059453.1 unnamed protein product [Rotaria magnacalcarata]